MINHHIKPRIDLLLFLLLGLPIFMISCGDEGKKTVKKDRFSESNFFNESQVATKLSTLKNELANDHTQFLRSFGEDEIAWQKWDASLLEKARSSQRPIMALVGSSLDGNSRNVGKELSENPSLRKAIASQSVCTVIDTHVFPEIGTLSYHLLSESQNLTTFPTLIWLSHEGSPLASIPIGELSGRELEIVITNSSAMVQDTWITDSEYAVEDSRTNNKLRQQRFDLAMKEASETEERDEVFRSSTRQLSSLYSFGDRNLDSIGGLIPTNSLELLAIGAQSNLLTDEIRKHCRSAASEVAQAIVDEALKDHLDGSYFFARRTIDWSLPAFSKNISTQARIAHMLIRVGSILENKRLLEEGFMTLSVIENSWLSKPLSSISPSKAPDDPGKFFWDFETLEQTLSVEELPLAISAFSLKEEGNILPEVDPLQNYYKLNTLRRNISLEDLAKQQQKSVAEIEIALRSISQKLLKHREKITQYDYEDTLCATDLALILQAQLARAVSSGKKQDLESAVALAERLLKDFYDANKGLSRLVPNTSFITARCEDYATTSNSLFLLYQATLDEKWLNLALKILDEAMTKLASDNGLLSEIPEDARIIPIRQHNRSMIFANSSLGILDLSLNRAWAITGEIKYQEMFLTHGKTIAPLAKLFPVSHTDFITSCALGTNPLVAVLKGNPQTPSARELLSILNSQKHLPFLSIRAAKKSDTNLESSVSETGVSITLIRNGQPLGSASSASSLEKLLKHIISEN